ncbi:MAG: SPOR domain-containing protein [Gemmatimonadales bacterium]
MERSVATAFILFAVACGREKASPPPDLPATGGHGQVSLLRFPSEGGPVQAYYADSLGPAAWTSFPVPPTRLVLGADLDQRLLWAIDTEDSLVSIDLETRAVRKRLARVVTGTVGPDGSLYLADQNLRVVRIARREAAPFHDPLPARARALFAAVNDQVITVTGPPARLITANPDQVVHSTPLPPGDVSATAWGDMVAVATDSGVFLYETGGARAVRALASVERARQVAFSPSGHRLYVSRDEGPIRVFDRFTLKELPPVQLPGRAREFRPDASGRWLLAHRAAGDSVWIIDLTTNRETASVLAEWSSDLPLVAGPSTLVVRQGDDVVALDLLTIPVSETGRLPEGGRDRWLLVSWVPPERVPAALAAADSARLLQDSTLTADLTPARTDSTQAYLQVSRTQNPEWAGLLVKQLVADGFPASVLDPVEPEDGFRVAVGPYPNREAADSVGRAIGRAYFLIWLPGKRP